MRETLTNHMKRKGIKHLGFYSLSLALTAVCLYQTVSAESLFRAGIAYQTSQPFIPHSLYAVPRPGTIGDMVTININEMTRVGLQNSNTLSRQQNTAENNVNFFNRVIQKYTKIKDLFPSVDGIQNLHQVDVTAKSQKSYSYRDTITCQVVQVLPNGSLIVQGKKTTWANQEQQDLYVSGIVNPYYLDASNTIGSNQVANFQMNLVGHGTLTRQQGDGVIGKYFQLFN